MPTPPNTRDFTAVVDLRPGNNPTLTVTGQVETTAGNKQPRLSPKTPQGINPQHRLFDLTIVQTGDFGTADVGFRPLRHTEPASAGQYSDVVIFWQGTQLLSLPVQELN